VTAQDTALSRLEAVVVEWEAEKAEQKWAETMRQCAKCRAWVNRFVDVDDLVRVCPNFNLCSVEGE
jgi:hypothetical protein